MAKPRNREEQMAVEAARRLDQARAMGQQLSMLPEEPGATPQEAAGVAKGPGRPKGATSKGSSQMRDYLAARGMRMPEDVLAEMAGLASDEGAMLTAMRHAEQVLGWAYSGSAEKATAQERIGMFCTLYAAQLRAADALLPYGTPKAAPDAGSPLVATLVIQGHAAQPEAPQMRDVTPQGPAALPAMRPLDVEWEMLKKQQVSQGESAEPQTENRTDTASD